MPPPPPPPTIQSAYSTLSSHYTTSNPTSSHLHTLATATLPGGNTRTVLHYAPSPLSMTRASNSRLYSADNHTYTDFLGEYTAGLYGHSDPVIRNAIVEALERGVSYGSQHGDEVRLADVIRSVSRRWS